MSDSLNAYASRYEIHNIRWTRSGPRSGLLRRRGWKQRIWKVGTARDIEVAAALLADAPLYSDEALYVYDNEQGGRRIAARYGQCWSGE